MKDSARPAVAEFFAGIGLVRFALEREGFRIVFANDIEPTKRALYEANFGADHFMLGDVRKVNGKELPGVELATASFPCTDLSLAGNRAGLAGRESSVLWEFARVLREMGERRPFAVMLENVVGFATSHDGEDLRAALKEFNALGYWCDLFTADARRFVPQSRPRMFIVGSRDPLIEPGDWQPSAVRPPWVARFVTRHQELRLNPHPLVIPPSEPALLADVVERLPVGDARWWDKGRVDRFLDSLTAIQARRAELMRNNRRLTWATTYRRTRQGEATWEIRADSISGCLRTSRGGSSRQALVEAGHGELRVRWMMPLEYGRLQGAGEFKLGRVTENQALFGFGDAVCVPVIRWIARDYLMPLVERKLTRDGDEGPTRRGRGNPSADSSLPAAAR